jgi:predicted ArsR family transcriptional regulator
MLFMVLLPAILLGGGGMAGIRRDQRYFSSTRGQVVSLLRRASHTVDELAAALDLTDNAVRSHLAILERDGLVEQQGVRRGRGKPAYRYELTAEADVLFPKAHGLVLAELVQTLVEQLGPTESEDLLRLTGRRLASGRVASNAGLADRMAAAAEIINELGGLAELEERDGAYLICGFSCPLGVSAHDHPQLCQLAEALIAELTGQSVQECCDRGQRPRCRFRIELPSFPSRLSDTDDDRSTC